MLNLLEGHSDEFIIRKIYWVLQNIEIYGLFSEDAHYSNINNVHTVLIIQFRWSRKNLSQSIWVLKEPSGIQKGQDSAHKIKKHKKWFSLDGVDSTFFDSAFTLWNVFPRSISSWRGYSSVPVQEIALQ